MSKQSRLPRISTLFLFVFLGWVQFLRWLRVEKIWVKGSFSEVAGKGPVLWVGNHVSWWDGFTVRQLALKLRPKSPFYVVMLESVWEKNRWLRSVGTLPIDPSKPMTVKNTFKLIAESRLSAAFFPQGKILPSHRRPLGFQRGIDLLMRMHLSREGAVVLPFALHWEPMNTARPQLFVRVGEPIFHPVSKARIEKKVTELLDEILADRSLNGERVSDEWKPL